MLSGLLLTFLASGIDPSCTKGGFLGLLPWWAYLPPTDFTVANGKCDLTNFSIGFGFGGHGGGSDVLLVVLAIIDDLLRIAGVVAIAFIIYAAFNFITSQGNPEDTKKARGTAINALIGLVFALVAVVLVSFIGSSLGGK